MKTKSYTVGSGDWMEIKTFKGAMKIAGQMLLMPFVFVAFMLLLIWAGLVGMAFNFGSDREAP